MNKYAEFCCCFNFINDLSNAPQECCANEEMRMCFECIKTWIAQELKNTDQSFDENVAKEILEKLQTGDHSHLIEELKRI